MYIEMKRERDTQTDGQTEKRKMCIIISNTSHYIVNTHSKIFIIITHTLATTLLIHKEISLHYNYTLMSSI